MHDSEEVCNHRHSDPSHSNPLTNEIPLLCINIQYIRCACAPISPLHDLPFARTTLDPRPSKLLYNVHLAHFPATTSPSSHAIGATAGPSALFVDGPRTWKGGPSRCSASRQAVRLQSRGRSSSNTGAHASSYSSLTKLNKIQQSPFLSIGITLVWTIIALGCKTCRICS